jgi:hypothetical protein
MSSKTLITSMAIATMLSWPPSAAASSPSVSQDLAAVRAATAKYHDPAAAQADGYLPTHECAESPDGVMGYHWINPMNLSGQLDLTKPQVLLYQPRPNGDLRR